MLEAINKARAFSTSGPSSRTASLKTPPAFRPPYGGAAYFGQAYRWEQVLHYRYWAFVAIRAIVNEIAGGKPPVFGAVKYGTSTHKKYKSLGGPQDHEDFKPYAHDHPICRLFRNPNGPDVAYDLWAYHTLFLSLTGTAYWWVVRNTFNVPVEIWVVPTHWVRPLTDGDGSMKSYFVQSPWGMSMEIPASEIVSFYEHSPLNRWEGHAVSQAVSEWIDVYESLTRMRLATFKNGAVPALHVMLGDSYADPDEAFLARFYARWMAKFQGENRSGMPLITGSDVEVKAIDGHRPADALAATIQSEEQIRDIVLAAYGVPKGVVGIEPVNDTSAYAPQRQFCRFTINPKLTYMGQVITEKIVKPTPGCNDGIAYWEDRVVDDMELTERQIAADLATGVRTVNEVRLLRGLPPYPHGGDDPTVNGNTVPWQTGKSPVDSELVTAFNKALDDEGS